MWSFPVDAYSKVEQRAKADRFPGNQGRDSQVSSQTNTKSR